MATSLPWNVKGVDPRTRDAARAAARRAGMTLGEWLDSVIREEAADAPHGTMDADLAADELDALSERLSRLSQEEMATSTLMAQERPARRPATLREVKAGKNTPNADERTAAALDSIARWIEKTEQRLSSSERVTAERQDRATSVVADALKTIGSRIADIERRDGSASPAHSQPAQSEPATRNGRPVLSRESMVSDILLRQRNLDGGSALYALPTQLAQREDGIRHSKAPLPLQASADMHSTEELLAGLRQELRDLGSRISTSGVSTHEQGGELQELRSDLALLRNDVLKLARSSGTTHIETAIHDLAKRMQHASLNGGSDKLVRPLARIEAEIARLSDRSDDPVQHRIESELTHIAGKIDALASRGSDGRMLAAATRELSTIRDMIAEATGSHKLEELAGKLSTLAGDMNHVRENQVKSRDFDALQTSINDLRKSMASQQDGGGLVSISRQIEELTSRISDLPVSKSRDVEMHLAKIAKRVDERAGAGTTSDPHLSNRIEALVIKLEDLAERAPARLESKIETLSDELGRLQANTGSSHELGSIDRKIEGLAERLEQLATRAATPDGSSRLEQQIESIGTALATLTSQGAAPKTSPALERQIEAMAARLESLADSNRLTQVISKSEGDQVVVDMRPLEEMVRSLSRKMDEAQRPGANSDTLSALEKQVGHLAEKLDIVAAARADRSLETTLQSLVSHFQGLQSETAAAAERAARAALASEFQRIEHKDTGGIAKLNDALNSLQAQQNNSGQQTSTALDAVHTTLERIVSRLGMLEADLTRENGKPAAAPIRHAETQAPALQVSGEPQRFERRKPTSEWNVAPDQRVERRKPAPEPVTSLDIPLEPGSGRPTLNTSSSSSASAGSADAAKQGHAVAPAGDLRNIIAAARRAAQTVKNEAATAQMDVATPSKRSAKAGSGLKETIEKRRKPLLLGLAAIMVALGATHIVTGQLQQRAGNAISPEVSKAIVESTPAESVPAKGSSVAPADAPLPAKDQNSMLSPAIVAPAQASAPFVRQVDPNGPSATSSFVPPASTPSEMAQKADTPSSPGANTIAAVTGLKDLPTTLGTAGLRKAAMNGDARAVYELAVRAADGVGGPRDPKAAIKLFERAAGAGLPPAQFRLGNMFEKGVGTPRDVTLARLWYERAADKGNAKAMHNLAVLYAEGASGKPDYAMAVDWFKKASEHGMRDSQFNLGVLMARGLGTEQNLVQSWTWFAVGAAQGDEDAAKKRDEVGLKLSPTELAAAKIAVSQWKPKSADPSANEVAMPPQGWEDLPVSTQKKLPKAKNV